MQLNTYQTMLVAFIGSFVVIAGVVMMIMRTIPAFVHIWPRFAGFLQQRAFPLTSGQERNKFAILRICFGFIIFMRAVDVATLLLPEEYFTPVGIYNGMEFFFALFIMIGFCTQFALGFFMFVMWLVGEAVLGTSTLGNDIGAMLAVFFILTESGRNLSVDSLLIRRFPILRPVLGYGAQIPGNTPITIAKFLLVTSYWLMCVYSFLMHLNESAWMTGVAGPMLFVSNFMSRFHALFEPILLESSIAVLLARISLVFMMVWYVMLMPWVLLGGWWRRFIIIWGILFFILSGVILQLGSLAYIEALMWIALFWPRWGVDDTKKLLLFYDDKCNLCDRTVQFVRTVDVFDRVVLTPVSHNHAALAQYGISVDAALEDLHGVMPPQGTVHAGYALYEALARHLVLLWMVIPILWLGRVTTIGPALYRYIAARRRAMFGVCTLPRPKPEWHTGARPSNELSPLFHIVSWHLVVLSVIYAVSMPAPYIGIKGNDQHPIVMAAQFYGIAPINVFNNIDLQMVDNWFTLADAQTDTILPILDVDGSRLAYHRSDRIYFGNTVRFRRGEIGAKDCSFTRREKSIRYLANVWMSENGITGTRVIRYTQYYRPHPDQQLLAQNIYRINPVTVRCTVDFSITR